MSVCGEVSGKVRGGGEVSGISEGVRGVWGWYQG